MTVIVLVPTFGARRYQRLAHSNEVLLVTVWAIFVSAWAPNVTVEAWQEFEVYSAVTPTTSTRFVWFATVCDHATVVVLATAGWNAATT